MSARRIAIVVVGALTAPFAVALFVNALWTFCQWLGWSPEGAAVFVVACVVFGFSAAVAVFVGPLIEPIVPAMPIAPDYLRPIVGGKHPPRAS